MTGWETPNGGVRFVLSSTSGTPIVHLGVRANLDANGYRVPSFGYYANCAPCVLIEDDGAMPAKRSRVPTCLWCVAMIRRE